MWRTYPQAAPLVMAAIGSTLLLPGGLSARAVFDSKPLQEERFAVLGQPVGQRDWKLLVLEQIRPRPRCWTPRGDGLVEPTLNTFNFAGICSRYLDSNGYSLRSGGRDLTSRFRLRLRQIGRRLELQALDPAQPAPIQIGSADVPSRDRNGFVKIRLDSGWALERRVYQGRTLSHVYFAHADPVHQLLAKASRTATTGSAGRADRSQATPIQAKPKQPRRVARRGPIPLEVIPYRP